MPDRVKNKCDLKDEQTENLTFLMCTERCGSNLITKLLNNHTQVCGPLTKHIINPLARNYFRYRAFDKQDNWNALLKDVLNLFNAPFSIWKSGFTLNELQTEVAPGDLQDLIFYLYNKEAEAHRKSHIFIKETKLYEFYPFLKSHFPGSNFVYQVRDPRDMALSWKKSQSHKGGVIAAARQWKTDQQEFLKLKALESNRPGFTFLKYEDLISSPEKELSLLLNRLGVNFERSMLRQAKDELTQKNAKNQAVWQNISKPVLNKNFNKYKTELSGEECDCIERICFFEMNHLGYKTEKSWSELNRIKPEDIEKFHQKELKSISYTPAKGVIDNIRAKKRFYQHLS